MRLAEFDLLRADEYRQLSSGYVFLRTIEHSLQLMHNKQEHSLPDSPRELAYLARRLDFPNADVFLTHYTQHCRRSARFTRSTFFVASRRRHRSSCRSEPSTPTSAWPRPVYREIFNDEQAERHLDMLDQAR